MTNLNLLSIIMKYRSVFDQAWKLAVNNDPKKALLIAKSTLIDVEKDKNVEGQALMLKIIAKVRQYQGEPKTALRTFKKLEPLYIQLNKTPEQMHTIKHIRSLFLELGKAECAERCLVQVVENYEVSETKPLEKANALSLEQRNQDKKAQIYQSKAKQEYKIIGLAEGIKECDSHLF